MTPEEINTLIAESLGWTVFHGTLCAVLPDKNGEPEPEPVAPLPDYHSSLDACAEFEATMDKQEQSDYICALGGLCQEPDLDDWAGVCFATAPQRCEAYLKLKGLWKEGAK